MSIRNLHIPNSRLFLAALAAAAIGVIGAGAAPASAATIWDGPSIDFQRANEVDGSDPANQDLITPGVVMARGATKGLFNAALESAYSGTSPADTEWAWVLNNPGAEVSAANYADLDFAPWAQAHGGRPPDTVGIPGVLHIISADIYIDIMFTSWTAGGGGGFAYTRSTAIPEPGAALLLGAVFGLWGVSSAARRRS